MVLFNYYFVFIFIKHIFITIKDKKSADTDDVTGVRLRH